MNLIAIGIFGILFLIVLAIISNVSAESIVNIQDQMYLSQCPLPIYDGTVTLNSIDGYVLNYTVTYSSSVNGTGTFFECSLDLLSTPHFNANSQSKEYGATLFGFIPIGWIGFISDSLTVLGQRIYAVGTLVSFFVAPTNFNILGYTLNDLIGIALFIVVALYGLCYVAIGAMLYKIFYPFSGAS